MKVRERGNIPDEKEPYDDAANTCCDGRVAEDLDSIPVDYWSAVNVRNGKKSTVR
jgi:hypothetical protein